LTGASKAASLTECDETMTPFCGRGWVNPKFRIRDFCEVQLIARDSNPEPLAVRRAVREGGRRSPIDAKLVGRGEGERVGSRGDNGDWPSDEGSFDDLPDLPEEWGVIVIPDDLSELSDEVAAVQAELRRSGPPTRWQRFAARPAIRRLRRFAAAGVRAPVLIISMAVLVTVASLFASAWPGSPRTPAVQRTADSKTDDTPDGLPALDLLDQAGNHVSLAASLPAVVLVTDSCDCAKLVSDTIAAVPPDITVITVVAGATTPAPAGTRSAGTPATGAAPQPQGKKVRTLRDPTGELRTDLKLGRPDGTAAALLVNRTGTIIQRYARTSSVEDLRPYLNRL
jgi:hypothetical protein